MIDKKSISTGKTLKDRVAGELEQTIKAQMNPGDKLLPEVELAKELGVSRGTVRNALDMLEGAGLISRQKKVGTVVTARARTLSIAFFFSGPQQIFGDLSYAAPVFRAMTEEAGRAEVDIMFLSSATKIGHTRAEHVRLIPWDKVDGAIIYEDFSEDFLQALTPFRDKVVVADNDMTKAGLTSVVFDNREGGRLAARKLIEAGRTRIAWFGELTDHGNGVDPAYVERYEGFSSELARNGLALPAEMVFDVPRQDGADPGIGERAADLIASGKLTGLFALMAGIAPAIKEHLAARGKACDFSAITVETFGKEAPLKTDHACIGWDGGAMGVLSVQAILALIKGQESPGLLKSIPPVFWDESRA
ncbi:GntR family transcriptional regulator [Planctomycetota bacterium]